MSLHTASTRVRTLAAAAPRRALVAVVTVAALLAGFLNGTGVALAATSTPPLGYFTKTVVSDSFNRSVHSNWGTAPVGGTYRSSGSSGKAVALGGNGYFNGVRSGHSRVQQLPIPSSDLLELSSFSFTAVPHTGSWGAYLALETRAQANGSAYTATVHVTTGGHAALLIDRRPASGSPRQLAARSLPTMVANRGYYFQTAVIGTRIWARVWRMGTRAAGWISVTDSSAARISGAGEAGVVLAAVGSSRATASAKVGYLDIRIPAHPATSTAPKSSAPTSSAPTSSAPTSSAPTSPAPTSSAPTSPAPTSSSPTSSSPTSSTPSSSSSPQPVSTHAAQVESEAGSLPVGSAAYPVPAGAVFVATTGSDSTGTGSISAPFATVARAIKSTPLGGTIVVRGGVYNASTFVNNGLDVTVQAYPNEAVWFDGSTPVTGWTQSGSTWIHSGWTPQFDHSQSYTSGSNAGGFVNPAYPMAAWPDQVFFDGTPLQQVAANPTAGEFAVSYSTQQLIVGSDPTGVAVRASNLSTAFVAGGTLNLRGIGIRDYATSLPALGTVYLGGSAGPSTIENVVFENSATTSLTTNNAQDTINHVSLIGSGMTGIGMGHADGSVVENCLFDDTDAQHFNAAPASAGLKVVRTNGITIENNLAENGNNIAGLWTDENTTNFTIVGNVVINNGSSYGIENELSGTGIVANNTITGSRFGYTAFDSGDISVYNNDLDDNSVWDIGLSQDNRWEPGMGTAGPSVQPSPANPWLVRNIVAANNNFGMSNGSFQFYVLDKQTNRPASSMNISLLGNLFAPKSSASKPYAIGWGMGDNVTVHMYATPTAFDSGEGYTFANSQSASTSGQITPSLAGASFAAPTSSDDAVAVALSSAIAAAIGQATGTRSVGTF